MSPSSRTSRLLACGSVGIALIFGVATVAAGASVLLGRDAGYVVYRPLQIFNTAMGVAYAAAAVLIWRDRARDGLP